MNRYLWRSDDKESPVHLSKYNELGAVVGALCGLDMSNFNRSINRPFALGRKECAQCVETLEKIRAGENSVPVFDCAGFVNCGCGGVAIPGTELEDDPKKPFYSYKVTCSGCTISVEERIDWDEAREIGLEGSIDVCRINACDTWNTARSGPR